MVDGARIFLNENQIELLQGSLEYLHNIQDWELLTEAIVIEGIKLIGRGKGLFLVFDYSLKQLIPQASLDLSKQEKKKLTKMAQKLFLNKSQEGSIQEGNTYFFPIFRQREFSSVFVIEPQQSDNLSKEQISLITIFMQSISVVLENSRLFLIMQRKTKSLNLINQLHQLTNQYSFQDILAEMVQKVGELLHSDMAGVMLYDPEKNELVLQKPAFGFWDDSIIKQYRVSLNEDSNAKQVFLTGISTITMDASQDKRYKHSFIDLFQAKTIITVPLVVDQKRIGILHAINKKTGFFTQDDLKLLLETADHLGVILEAAVQLASSGKEDYKRNEIERYLMNQLFGLLKSMNDEKIQETTDIMNTLEIIPRPRIGVLKIGLYKNGEMAMDLLKEYSKSVIEESNKVLNKSCSIYQDGSISVLFPHETEKELIECCERLQRLLQGRLRKELQGIEVFLGIGESVDRIGLLSHSYHQAGQILSIIPSLPQFGYVGYYPSCGSWTLLSNMMNHNAKLASTFTNLYLNKVNQLKDSKEMKETLDVYLKYSGQIKKAAEELFIHQNTLKYRIDKLLDITGLDLSDSETRLNLMLALRMEQLLQTS